VPVASSPPAKDTLRSWCLDKGDSSMAPLPSYRDRWERHRTRGWDGLQRVPAAHVMVVLRVMVTEAESGMSRGRSQEGAGPGPIRGSRRQRMDASPEGALAEPAVEGAVLRHDGVREQRPPRRIQGGGSIEAGQDGTADAEASGSSGGTEL
jgi:hypothetical protein